MAMSEYYVDPSIAANSGTGTIGDPYGDLQYAIDSITKNATDGERINIKSGAEEVFSAAIDWATGMGAPWGGAPTLLQGYDSAAGDGGICEIDMGGNAFTQASAHVKDAKIRNMTACGGQYADYENVWLSDCTGLATAFRCMFQNCVFSDFTGTDCINVTTDGFLGGCYFEFAAGEVPSDSAIKSSNGRIQNCIVNASADVVGIEIAGTSLIENCSLLQTAATATSDGILFKYGGSSQRAYGCIVEGFDNGFNYNSQTSPFYSGYNAAYDNVTDYSETELATIRGNEALSSSAFAKSGTITLSDFVSDNAGFWASVAAYFEPQDTGNVFGNFGFNALTKGAVPRPARTVSPSRHPLARF